MEPGCRLPQNYSGDWVNTANMDADVFINETHIIETWYPDEARYRRTIYVCREQRGSRYMMARLTVDGWYKLILFYNFYIHIINYSIMYYFKYSQKDYVCFDFVPRHHNVIRYRRGIAFIKDSFHTACSWVQFPNKDNWKYDIFVCKYFYIFN